MAVQIDMWGNEAPTNRVFEPHELPKPKNGHAISLLILMQNQTKWVDIIFVIKKYVYPKFQTRLAEIAKVYPELVEKRKVVVMTRFGNKTDTTQYRLKNYESAFNVYMNALNVEGGMYKVINGVRVINSDTVASSQ